VSNQYEMLTDCKQLCDL